MLRKTSLLLIVLFSISSVPLAFSAGEIESIQIDLRETNDLCPPATSEQPECTVEELDNTIHRGWPVNLNTPGAGFPYTPTLCDIDGDGADEIFLSGGETFGLSGDGNFLSGWPTGEMAYMGYGTNDQMSGPSCADMEGNGTVEILWSLRDWYAGTAHYWTFNGRNSSGTNMTGFPLTAPDESSNALDSPFVLGDSDGDGNLEAWTAHTLGNTGAYYRISCLDHLGELKFTTDLDPDEQILNLFFGDADGNDIEEFFAVTLFNGEFRLHLFTSTGAEQAGYPIGLFSPGGGNLMFGPPMSADLDDDGDLEMIVGYYESSVSYAVARHHDGTPVAGFPITIATTSQLFYLGLGDITTDGYPELIAVDNHLGSGYRVHTLDISTGLPLTGWPVAQTNWPEGLPTIVDVNNDGFQDVCFVTNGGELFALSSDGSVIPGYPKMMSGPSISGVSAGDIDGDGYYELVASTWDGFVYAWDTDGIVAAGRCDWPMRGVDARNTGIYRAGGGTGITEIPELTGAVLSISSNPVMGSTVFTLNGSTNSSIILFDVTGKQISEISFNGSDQVGWTPSANVPAGVYFAKLAGESGNTLKILIIR